MTNTISTDVTYANGITLGSNGYSGNLTITATGTVQPSGNGATAIYNSIAGYTVVNYGTVIGGGGNGGAGGAGIVLSAGTLTNDGQITGGEGGRGGYSAGSAGGDGVLLDAGTLTNDGTISGGEGGEGSGSGGAGGDGVLLSAGTLTNDDTITGGEGGGGIFGRGGAGGDGVVLSAGTLTNHRQITGGSGSSIGGNYGGAGGAGVVLSPGTLTNDGTITGGSGGEGSSDGGAGGAGVVLTTGMLTNDGQITGGEGGNSFYGGAGGAGVVLSAGTLTNDGQITGGSGGSNAFGGRGAGGAGVSLDGGTLINAGTITGYGGEDAVRFGIQAATLIVDPGAVFIGAVVAQASVADVLEFSGTSATALTGIGAQFQNFNEISFATGAAWTIGGNSLGLAAGQTINGFSTADTIDLSGIVATSESFAGDVLTLFTGTTELATLTINEAQSVTSRNFMISSDGVGGTDISMTIPCFAEGTRILTADGRLVAVERLAAGDAVEIYDGTASEIIWAGRRRIDLTAHPRPDSVRPIRIAAGALGGGLPWQDLVVSPDHGMYLDGHLIPAKILLNGGNIRQLDVRDVTYYHIELAKHAVLFAEGVPAESYLETGNRGAFENEAVTVLHPDFAQIKRGAESCAPFVEAGAVVEEVRQRILDRAGIATTNDPDLQTLVQNGEAIIASRAAIPGEIFADPRDRRLLGVKIAAIEIAGKKIPLDHPALIDGWHNAEPDGRWTNGRAVIPEELLGDAKTVEISLAAALIYPCTEQTRKRRANRR